MGITAVLLFLPTTWAEELQLFNGKDLSGWNAVLEDRATPMEEVWSVADNVLICRGLPVGYLVTERTDFDDFTLSLEWRWPKEGGNSGVLVFSSTPGTLGIWPKSLEVQLGSGDAGDFWVIGSTITIPDAATRRQDRRHLNLTDDSEKPLGQWNTMTIQSHGGDITVTVNGQLVNRASDCSERRGAIALQSEGTEIHFRNIRLVTHPEP
jgi:hypothetical protein